MLNCSYFSPHEKESKPNLDVNSGFFVLEFRIPIVSRIPLAMFRIPTHPGFRIPRAKIFGIGESGFPSMAISFDELF